MGIPTNNDLCKIVPNPFRAVLSGQGDPQPQVAARLTPLAIEGASVPNLSLSQIYPPPAGGINLNTCHDPDCGNYGVEAGFAIRSPKGERSETSVPALLSNSAAVGLGSYRLSSNTGKEHRRTSKVLEYEGAPHTWMDRKLMECRHIGAAGDPCSASFEILSNEHLAEEIARLEGMNGAYDRAACGWSYARSWVTMG